MSDALLQFNGVTLAPGQDREVTRHEIKRITGLSDGYLSRLAGVIPEINRHGLPKRGYYKTYSLRMVLIYCIANPVNEVKQKARKGKKLCQKHTNR